MKKREKKTKGRSWKVFPVVLMEKFTWGMLKVPQEKHKLVAVGDFQLFSIISTFLTEERGEKESKGSEANQWWCWWRIFNVQFVFVFSRKIFFSPFFLGVKNLNEKREGSVVTGRGETIGGTKGGYYR